MKRTILLIISLFVSISPSGAQRNIPDAENLHERVYIQTDKDIYLAGELVWLKMLTTTEAGIPLNFSKTGYVQLVNEAGPKAQVLIQLGNGVGDGTLLIPAGLETGCYRLIGYTRYQRNESPEVFFEKVIGVVNPVNPEVSVPTSALEEKFPFNNSSPVTSLQQSSVNLSVNQLEFNPRSPVEVRLDNIPEDIHTLSVAVVGKDLTNSLKSSPGITGWRATLPPTYPVSESFIAEYEGHIVNGLITSASSGEPTFPTRSVPLIAFQGNEVHVFTGQPNPDGKVSFHTGRANGYGQIVTTFAAGEASDLNLNIESPFISEHTSKPLPVLDIEKIDRDLLLDRSVSLQVQYAYVADSLESFDYPNPHFNYKPDYRYIMEDYRKFGTMREVITEYVSFVQFRTVNNKRQMSVIARDYGARMDFHALVLLDGIPIFDHEIIANYNPLLLQRIDVYLDQYAFGGLRFDGIVAMYTERNAAPELSPDPFTRIVQYDMPQAPRVFFSPDHSVDDPRDKRTPDFRHTLYWDPDVKVHGKPSVTIPFYTSDIPGDYRITVEGITATGETVTATRDIRVN